MREQAVAEMAASEDDHWWYVGLRDLLGRLLAQPRFAPPPRPRVLDVGCGTGATLRFLHDRLRPSYLGGFDLNPTCVATARDKCPAADVYAADVTDPQFSASQYDLILSCDVLSYVWPTEQVAALQRLRERLTGDGRLILHLPACPWLFSRHDRAVGTVERFTAPGLRRLLHQAGFGIELLTYRMSLLFPVVVAARLPAQQRFAPTDESTENAEPASDLRHGRGRLGSACRRVLQFENAAICRGVRWPIGSSLLVVARPGAQKSRGPAEGPRPELVTTARGSA